METLLAVSASESVPLIDWHNKTIRFRPDGTCDVL
jgi:hypothetical protein